LLWSMVAVGSAGIWGGGMLVAMAAGMILSPVLGLVLSWPLPVRDANGAATRDSGRGRNGEIGSGISHATI